MAFEPVDWHKLFAVDLPVLEVVLRGTIMFLFVFTILRITGRRSVGQLAMMDFVFILFLAIASDRAMMGEQTSIGSGIILISTLVAWNYLLNWIGYHIPVLQRLTAPAPIVVVENGRLNRRNMRREFLTEEELMTHVRRQGCDDLSCIKTAYIEGDGNISVITTNGA